MSELFCDKCKKKFPDGTTHCPDDGSLLLFENDSKLTRQEIFDERFMIIKKIGQGGMGSVYKAVQLSTGKTVAIKVIKKELSAKNKIIKRFKREVRLQSMLEHPNIVTVYDFAETKEDEYYLVMGFVEGKSLREFIGEKKYLDFEEFFDIASQLCEGLDYAHSKNIIHRDLKCDNVIVGAFKSQKIAKILDFGLAKALQSDGVETSTLTEKGMLLGTPAYMPPEQAKGDFDKVGPHSDIYSLGIIFYAMLTGEFPFKALTPMEMIFKHLHEPPIPARKMRKEIPVYLEKIIMHCLEKDPLKRFASCMEIKEALLAASKKMNGTYRIKSSEESGAFLSTSLKFFKSLLSKWFAFSFHVLGIVAKFILNVPLYLLLQIKKISGLFSFAFKSPRIRKTFLIAAAIITLFIYFDSHPLKVREFLNKVREKKTKALKEQKKATQKKVLRGGLKIITQPAGADVKINNMQSKKGPALFSDLIPGIYNVHVEKEGYYSRDVKVEVHEGKNVEGEVFLLKIKKTFKPKPMISKTFVLTTSDKDARLKFSQSNILKMVWVPSGYFDMGSDNGEVDERPVHRVIISKGFFIGEHEVTQSQWKAVMGNDNNPSKFKGDNHPVESVSFDECKKYISRLNTLVSVKAKGLSFRLPFESEWEYACMAGEEGNFHGDPIDSIAWFEKNSGSGTHEVGLKKSNAFGIYDMHGNVNEWCEDWYAPYSGDTLTDPKGPSIGDYRIRRGGPWNFPAYYLRSSYRYHKPEKYDFYGFRIVLSKNED